MNLSLRVSNEKGGHKKVPLPFSVASKMSGSLRQDSSRDCLGSVLADVGPFCCLDREPVNSGAQLRRSVLALDASASKLRITDASADARPISITV